jgi:hypothetical protein
LCFLCAAWLAGLLMLALHHVCLPCPDKTLLLQISNKSVAEINATVESKISAADTGKRSIFTGDMSIAQSAAEALKQHLARNVELLSSMNALLFPQPGANHAMEFSRCGAHVHVVASPQNLIRWCI